jgi:hypothetical protein
VFFKTDFYTHSKLGVSMSKYLSAMHDPCPDNILNGKGWIVFTEKIGHNVNDHNGADYTHWSNQGLGIISRLNNDYGETGTITLPEHYQDFSIRCGNFVRNTKGCHKFLIANEPNMARERPYGQPIFPKDYSLCFSMCYTQIKIVDANYQVGIGAIAPWNAETRYPGNERGDWVKYLEDVLLELLKLNIVPDFVSLHTYTHGPEPILITDTSVMNVPFQDRHYNFIAYQDFMAVIPAGIAVYITETDQNDEWLNSNTGWIKEAYREINEYNKANDYPIKCLALYRWGKFDKYHIDGNDKVIQDFKEAQEKGYTNIPEDDNDMEIIFQDNFENGFSVRENQGEIVVANDWNFGYDNNFGHRPEWKPEQADIGSGRVRTGQFSQKWFTTFSKHSAYISRVIENVEPEQWYKLTAWVYVWSSSQDNPDKSEQPGKVWIRCGINPWGDANGFSFSTQWGTTYVDVYDQWFQLECIVKAKSDRIVLFLSDKADFGAKHNDVYWDDVQLESFDFSEPPPVDPPVDPPVEECECPTADEIRIIMQEELSKLTICQS